MKWRARLADRVGRALEPVRVVGRLLGREDLDEPAREQVHAVRLGDVPVERRRVELRQHVDPADVGVQAVADRHVDQPVLAGDRNRGLRAEVGEREQPGAAAAAENEGEDVLHAVLAYGESADAGARLTRPAVESRGSLIVNTRRLPGGWPPTRDRRAAPRGV